MFDLIPNKRNAETTRGLFNHDNNRQRLALCVSVVETRQIDDGTESVHGRGRHQIDEMMQSHGSLLFAQSGSTALLRTEPPHELARRCSSLIEMRPYAGDFAYVCVYGTALVGCQQDEHSPNSNSARRRPVRVSLVIRLFKNCSPNFLNHTVKQAHEGNLKAVGVSCEVRTRETRANCSTYSG